MRGAPWNKRLREAEQREIEIMARKYIKRVRRALFWHNAFPIIFTLTGIATLCIAWWYALFS